MAKGTKTGGRQKGSLNKTTRDIRELLKGFLSAEIENIPGYLNEIPAEKKLQIIIKLLPYVVPVLIDKQKEEDEASNNTHDFIKHINNVIASQNSLSSMQRAFL